MLRVTYTNLPRKIVKNRLHISTDGRPLAPVTYFVILPVTYLEFLTQNIFYIRFFGGDFRLVSNKKYMRE